jgi:hypothetical protein
VEQGEGTAGHCPMVARARQNEGKTLKKIFMKF